MRKNAILLLFIVARLSAQAQTVPSIVGAGKAIDPYHYTIVKKADYSKASVSAPAGQPGWGRGNESRRQCI
jgi:hypothetical protein